MTYFRTKSGYPRPPVKPAKSSLGPALMSMWVSDAAAGDREELYAETHAYHAAGRHDFPKAVNSARRRLLKLAKTYNVEYDAAGAKQAGEAIIKGMETDIAAGVVPTVTAGTEATALASYARDMLQETDVHEDILFMSLETALNFLRWKDTGNIDKAADYFARYMSARDIPLRFLYSDYTRELPVGAQLAAARVLAREFMGAPGDAFVSMRDLFDEAA